MQEEARAKAEAAAKAKAEEQKRRAEELKRKQAEAAKAAAAARAKAGTGTTRAGTQTAKPGTTRVGTQKSGTQKAGTQTVRPGTQVRCTSELCLWSSGLFLVGRILSSLACWCTALALVVATDDMTCESCSPANSTIPMESGTLSMNPLNCATPHNCS